MEINFATPIGRLTVPNILVSGGKNLGAEFRSGPETEGHDAIGEKNLVLHGEAEGLQSCAHAFARGFHFSNLAGAALPEGQGNAELQTCECLGLDARGVVSESFPFHKDSHAHIVPARGFRE